jgi:dTDP-4-amino-4,6-dideoxygalactose transaminase/predicted dehydrogenase
MDSLAKRAFRKLNKIALRKLAAVRSPLKVAIIGYGGIGPDHMDAYENTGIARVVAVSDLRPQALGAATRRRPYLRAFQDYRHMLEEMKPDVVSICTWPQNHAEITEAAVQAGVKGILCEKPLALQLDDMKRMSGICASAGVKLACGHQYRFNPAFKAAADLVRSGALGKVSLVRGHIKGVLADNGPHLMDAVRFVLGDPKALSASCQCVREQDTVRQGLPAEEAARGEVVFENGARFEFESGDYAQAFFGMEIQGERGSLVVTPTKLEATDGIAVPSIPAGASYVTRQFKEFLQWVKGNQSAYVCTAESAALAVEMVLALYESVRIGDKVVLPLVSEGDLIWKAFTGSRELKVEEVPSPTVPSAIKALPPGERLAMHGGTRAVQKWFHVRPHIGRSEVMGVLKVLASGKLGSTEGNVVQQCATAFARTYGAEHAVASSSGTAAIHVAVGALQLEPGDEVITTPMSDMGTVIPILACNCIPVFADIDPETGNLTAETIARKLSPRTRAVIVVHLFGLPAEMDPIVALLKDKGIALIEDCAQAHYAEYRGRKVGTIGDFGCFSLQQSKHITCGDGGITLTNNPELAERASLYADKGWVRSGTGRAARNHYFLGMNYRMTELQGAVALAQVRRLPQLVSRRQQRADGLTHLLKSVSGVVPPAVPENVKPAWWVYALGIDEATIGAESTQVLAALAAEGVVVSTEYLQRPLFEYDVIQLQRTYGTSGYPYTAFPYDPPRREDYPGFDAFNRKLLLFWSHNVTEEQVQGIAAAMRKVSAQLRL